MNRPALLLVCCATALLGSGCHGRSVMEVTGGNPPVEPAPPSGCQVALAPASTQRLTKVEYNNVIRDLFGLSGDFSAAFSEPSAGSAGFTTEGTAQTLSPDIVLDFYHGANAVADALFAKSPNPLLTCAGGDACATGLITGLATRAFRRPPTSDEVTQLFTLYKADPTSSFEGGMKLVVTGVLLAPQFLFRTYDLPSSQAAQVPLTGYELASRLSFFLWGSIPDAALLATAADGTLTGPSVLQSQVQRMLKDPKASHLARTFGTQWLGLSELDAQVRSAPRYPLWSASMQASMKGETLAFLDDLVQGDHSVLDLITAKHTFVDQNVSQVYGISGTFTGFTRVPLDLHRVGILTQPAILAMTSNGDVTSPTRRGKWVLQRLLCSAPPPPPPNVPPLPPSPPGTASGESAIQQRLAQHRAQGPTCQGCHSAMDPIGLSFENFDAMGSFRTSYLDGKPVDASGQLPSGEQLHSAIELSNVLSRDSRFPECFAAKLSSFAQGRDMTTGSDGCGISLIAATAIGAGHTSSELILGIVSSDGFRQRTVTY